MKTKNIIGAVLLLLPLSVFASFDKDLFYGMRGEEQIMELQEFLAAENLYSGPITGNFYSLTSEGVKKFQKRESISTTGYFGRLTREKANQILNSKIGTTKFVNAENSNDKKQETESSGGTSDLQNLQKKIEELMSQIKLLQQVLSEKTSNSSYGNSGEKAKTVILPSGIAATVDSNGNTIGNISLSEPKKDTESAQPKISAILLSNSLSAKPNSNEQVLAKIQIMAKEDKLEITNISFGLKTSGDGKISDISNIMLIDQNGTIVAGPQNGNGDKEGAVTFSDTVTVKKGAQTYILRGNIGSSFASEQTIYTSVNMDTWNTSVPQTKIYVPPFQASEMAIYVASQNSQKNVDDKFTVKMTFSSNTELDSLTIRLKNKNDGSLLFIKEATLRNDKKTYDVEFQDILQGNYTLNMITDATKLIGVVKTFTEDYLVY